MAARRSALSTLPLRAPAVVYSRGALLLDALRRDLGDGTFWRGVRDYTTAGARSGSVESADLRAAMELSLIHISEPTRPY